MIDSIYHMTFELVKSLSFGSKTPQFYYLLRNVIWTSLRNKVKYVNH